MVEDDNAEGIQSLTFDHSMLAGRGRVFDAILDDTQRLTDINDNNSLPQAYSSGELKPIYGTGKLKQMMWAQIGNTSMRFFQ